MEKKRVLFVCSGPGVRGRIAEAFLTSLAPDRFEAHSAQYEDRSGYLPQFILDLMAEIDVPVKTDFPTSVFERHRRHEAYDYVITLCHASAQAVCPVFRVNVKVLYQKEAERFSWSIRDFRSLSKLSPPDRLAGARSIRDEIRKSVESFIELASSNFECRVSNN